MRRSLGPASVVLLAAALVGLLVYGVASRGNDTSIDAAVGRGERVAAPSRALPVLGEPGTRSLDAYRGRVVVLNFWASWCGPCRQETPMLERFGRSIERRGGTVLGVTSRDNEPDALAFVRRFGVTYPNLRDTGPLADAYGTRSLPETFVLDRRGRVVAVRRGPVDEAFLRAAVMPLLGEAS